MVKRVALAPKLDTAAAEGLRRSLLDSAKDDIVLDASAVEMIGALCLETLMSAGAIWKQAGRTITLENPSEQLTDDLGRFGLSPDTLLEYAA